MDPLSAHALYYLSRFELEIAWISIHTSAVLLCSFPLPIFATTICSRFNNSILPPVPVCQKRTVQSRLLYLDRHNRKGAKWNMPAFFLVQVNLAEIQVIASNNRMFGFEVNLLWRKALWTNQTTTWRQNEKLVWKFLLRLPAKPGGQHLAWKPIQPPQHYDPGKEFTKNKIHIYTSNRKYELHWALHLKVFSSIITSTAKHQHFHHDSDQATVLP